MHKPAADCTALPQTAQPCRRLPEPVCSLYHREVFCGDCVHISWDLHLLEPLQEVCHMPVPAGVAAVLD